jgi:hypothetical protein
MPTAMVVHRGGASQGMELKIRVPDLSLGQFRVDRDAWPGNGRLGQGVMLLLPQTKVRSGSSPALWLRHQADPRLRIEWVGRIAESWLWSAPWTIQKHLGRVARQDSADGILKCVATGPVGKSTN